MVDVANAPLAIAVNDGHEVANKGWSPFTRRRLTFSVKGLSENGEFERVLFDVSWLRRRRAVCVG